MSRKDIVMFGLLLALITTIFGNVCSAESKQSDRNDALYATFLDGEATIIDVNKLFELSDPFQMSNIINAMIRYRDQRKFVSVLESVWENETVKHPKYNWVVIRSPMVKISLAQVLYQISQKNIYKKYIYNKLKADNKSEMAAAVRSIGVIGSSKDIQMLVGIIINEDITVASSAIASLGVMDSEQSKGA